MGWSSDFVSSLSSGSVSPEFELRFVNINKSVGSACIVNSTGTNTYTGNAGLKIEAASVQVQGTSVVPQKWSVSFGGFSLGLVGDIRKIAAYIRRGQFSELWCRMNSHSVFERVAMGTLDNVSGSRGVWRLSFKDLLSGFQNTMQGVITANYNEFQLFSRAGIPTTTTKAIWNSGDTSITVTTALDWDVPTNGDGAIVKCYTTTPPGSDYFYLKFTGKTSTSLTGVSTINYPVGNVSTPSSLASGSTVVYMPWIQGRPWVVLARMLTSTGTGTNGPWDVWPAHWSIGGPMDHEVFDHYDARNNIRLIKRSDNSSLYFWSHLIESPWITGFRNFVNFAAIAGQWPVQRQGYISWRGCSDPSGTEMTYDPPLAATIETNDIHEIISHHFYHPSISNHYAKVKAKHSPTSGGGFTTTVVQSNFAANNTRLPSLPYMSEIERDLRNHYSDDDTTGADERGDMAAGDLKRMKGWDLYPSEKLTLRVSLRFAVLCAGDVVEITSQFLSGMYMGPGQSYQNQRAMVLNCSYGLGSASCVLQLGILTGRETK